MDAVKYFEEKKRMLNSLGRTKRECDGAECSGCPLSRKNNRMGLYCGELEIIHPEEAVTIVEKWSQEHPQKTVLEDFLEKHLKAELRKNGMPRSCAIYLGYVNECKGDCCKCWNRPLEE